MGIRRIIGSAAVVLSLLASATTAIAAPREPLIVVRMADPDPNYVPPPPEPARHSKVAEETDENPALDQAMLEFGRALGQATLAERQAIAAQCQSSEPANLSLADRFAWEASCRYSRH